MRPNNHVTIWPTFIGIYYHQGVRSPSKRFAFCSMTNFYKRHMAAGHVQF